MAHVAPTEDVVLVVGLLAFIAYQAVALPDTGPHLGAAVQRIEALGDHFVVHVRVSDDGGEIAEGVSVVGELRAAGGSVQRATPP